MPDRGVWAGLVAVARTRPARFVFRLAVILAIAAALIAPVVGDLVDKGGTEVDTEIRGDTWVVTKVNPSGAVAHAGLRPGDVVLALDESPPRARQRTAPMLDIGGVREWMVLRDGRVLVLTAAPVGAALTLALEPLLLVLIGLCFWAVAAFAWLSKPDDRLVRSFAGLNLATALAIGLSDPAANDVVWAKVVEVFAFGALPALFLGFCLALASTDRPARWVSTGIRAVGGSGLGLALLYLVAGFAGSNLYFGLRQLLLAPLAVALPGGLVILAVAYARSPSQHLRRQLQVVLLGSVAAILPATALSLVPEALGASSVVRPQFAALTSVALPVSFAFAILRRQLLGIEVLAERALIYTVMTLLLAGSYYALIVFGLSALGVSFFGPGQRAEVNSLISLAFFAVVTVTFVPIRDRVRQRVDQLIYHDRYDYVRTLQALGAQLASERPADETLATVVASLTRALNLRGAAVLLRTAEGELAARAAAGHYRDAAAAERLVTLATASDRDVPGEPGFGRWIPLVAHGEESGLLYLGPKSSGAELSPEDMSLAGTIASQAAVATANILLIERLQAKVGELELLRDRLLRVQEDERKRLAQDLHDGALHTVLDLVRRAEGVAEAPGASELDERLHDLVERGRDAAHELRVICSDLYPSELAHLGLVAALDGLARRLSRDEDVLVRFTPHAFPIDLRLPAEVENVLYRTASEALNNACRHARASVARVDLAVEGDQAVLTVQDDGHGFTPPASFAALLRKGHLGLASMRERVERLGGEFALVSQPGWGTRIIARLPRAALARDEAGAPTLAEVGT